MADPRLINVISQRAVPVAYGSDGSVLLRNRDELVTVYLGQEGISPGDTDVHVLDPLGTLSVDGSRDWWGVTDTGLTAQVQSTPGATDSNVSPSQIAQQIQLALTSAPLYSAGPLALPDLTGGGAVQLQNILPVNPVALTGAGLTGTEVSFYNSYEILVQCLAAALGIVGTCQVILTWYNQVSDVNPVATVKWTVPANNPGAVNTVGQGPMRGNFMAVQVASQETSGTALTTLSKLSLSGSLRQNSNGDYWQSDGIPIGNIASGAKTFSNELLIVSAAGVNAATTLQRGVLLYAGRVKLTAENNNTTGTLVCTIFQNTPPNSTIWHGAITQNAAGGAPVVVDLIFERVPMVFSVTNTGAAVGTLNAAIIADRV